MIRPAFAFALSLAAGVASANVTTIDLSDVANTRFDNPGFINGSTYPTGSPLLTLDGVDYLLPSTGNYMWHSQFHPGGGSPRSVTIPVNLPGIDVVYTLMGTWWGENSPGTFASITFSGSGGLVHTVALDGGTQIRDYNFNPAYTTSIDPTVTKEVWNNGTGVGTQHIDRQRFDLPAAFDTATLQSIVLVDNGSDGFQRTFIGAVSVQAIPESGT
jgi:hypothetical protein